MSNSSLTGGCPAPFLNEDRFPKTGGLIAGRFCAPLDLDTSDTICCLPCPATDYIYPHNFTTSYRVAESLNALGLGLCTFLLLSYIVLPAEKTRRHYLSVCQVIAIMILALGFVIPLGIEPDQCHNEITPNDMYSSMTCAWSGALIVFGGLATTVWIFVRVVSMHLQICWDIVPGKKFFLSAQLGGWGLVALFATLTLVLTGVSFRFGDVCHVNAYNSLSVFWGPLLAIAGLSTLIQIATFVYCINVYLQNIWSDDRSTTKASSDLPSYAGSINTYSAKAVYRRVRKVVWLQWRSMVIVVFILTDVIFLSVVFIWLNSLVDDITRKHHYDRIATWLLCLVRYGKANSQCLALGQDVLVNESTAMAILILLAIAGTQCFLLFARRSMFVGWYEFFRRKVLRNNEFVSVDAKGLSGDRRLSYELYRVNSMEEPMITSDTSAIKTPESVVTSPLETTALDVSYPDYFAAAPQLSRPNVGSPGLGGLALASPPAATLTSSNNITITRTASSSSNARDFAAATHDARTYVTPAASFSGPRTPGQSLTRHDSRGRVTTATSSSNFAPLGQGSGFHFANDAMSRHGR